MPRGILVLFAFLAFGVCSTEMSCSGPGRDIIPSDPGSANAKAAWSPDGKIIAVAWGGLPTLRKWGIYLINTEDWTTDTFLVPDDYNTHFSSPTWSATGEWLAFAANAQIYKIKDSSDSLTQLTHTSRQWYCDWSDSDSLIAYRISLGDSSGLWIMDSDGNNKRMLVRHGGHIDFTVGDSVLFIEGIPPDYKWARMALINSVDSTTREVYRWEKGKPCHFYDRPKVSADGQVIVLSIEGNIWTMTTEGKNLKQLTTDGGRYPNWSPDGSKIIYCKPSVEGGTLWIMNPDGTGKTQIEGW